MSAVGDVVGDLLRALDDDLARLRVGQVGGGPAADDPLAERLEQALLRRLAEPDAGGRAAVVLDDDHVLRDVDQTARQVAGVRGTERRVGQTLAGAVRGDEVLQHRQAFAEGRADRQVDDAAGRVGHQTAHAGHLRDLADVTLGATTAMM